MAFNKYPKGRGYTPNRPYSRTPDEAKALGLSTNGPKYGQDGTSGYINSWGRSYEESARELAQHLWRKSRQGPDRLRPKVKGSSTPIGRPKPVTKPKKK